MEAAANSRFLRLPCVRGGGEQSEAEGLLQCRSKNKMQYSVTQCLVNIIEFERSVFYALVRNGQPLHRKRSPAPCTGAALEAKVKVTYGRAVPWCRRNMKWKVKSEE